jgi:hypothetical protein
MRDRADPEDEQDPQGDERDRDGESETCFGSDDVQADEDCVEDQPPEGLRDRPAEQVVEDRSHVAADPHHDDGRREDVLHVLAQAGDEPAPGAHRGAAERIRAAGVGKGGGHLGDRVTETYVHDRDDDRGDQESAEPSRREPEVPAEEIPGDDGADAQRP